MLSRANPRPGVQEERGLRDSGFTPEAIAEVALQAAIVVVMNRLHTLIADQPEPMEKLGVAWYGPVVRPIARLMLRSKRRNAPGVAFAADYRGPFADLLAIFDGLPRAAVFSRILQAGMESPILPRRTKAWMLAVIGRAAGCDHSECEAIDLLKAEGIDAVAITRVIDHLGGPELDDIEMRLLRLARESVRYQPKAIQERVRAATATLKPPQIVEAAAICGIGNALARLSVLTERCD
jgi:alkylhydroperoxidase family enzyme